MRNNGGKFKEDKKEKERVDDNFDFIVENRNC